MKFVRPTSVFKIPNTPSLGRDESELRYLVRTQLVLQVRVDLLNKLILFVFTYLDAHQLVPQVTEIADEQRNSLKQANSL